MLLLAEFDRASVEPLALMSAIWKLLPRYRGHMQHDAHEFLRSLLEQVNSELLTLKPNNLPDVCAGVTVVSDLFGGKLQSSVECRVCRAKSKKIDPFLGKHKQQYWTLSCKMFNWIVHLFVCRLIFGHSVCGSKEQRRRNVEGEHAWGVSRQLHGARGARRQREVFLRQLLQATTIHQETLHPHSTKGRCPSAHFIAFEPHTSQISFTSLQRCYVCIWSASDGIALIELKSTISSSFLCKISMSTNMFSIRLCAFSTDFIAAHFVKTYKEAISYHRERPALKTCLSRTIWLLQSCITAQGAQAKLTNFHEYYVWS